MKILFEKVRNTFIIGILKIVDGIISICSLGFYSPELEYRFNMWYIFKK